MNYINERGDLFIDVKADDIHPKMLKRMYDVSKVAPDPTTGTININMSSYIRYAVKVLMEEILEEQEND